MPARDVFPGDETETAPPLIVKSDSLQLTIIDQASLITRLQTELLFLAYQAEVEWQELSSNPFAHLRRRAIQLSTLAAAWMKAPNRIAGVLSAVTLVVTVMLGVVFLEPARATQRQNATDPNDETLITMLPVPSDPTSSAAGFAANSKGRVGLNLGTGEGSSDENKRASGGGGGGDGTKAPAQSGAVPVPSEIPAPIVNPPKNPSLPLAGINIDPVLWKALPVAHYGDPRSESKVAANGPGTNGGMGDGDGQGIGEGDGPGIGRGRDGNTGGDSNKKGTDGFGGGVDCGMPSCAGSDRNRIFPPKGVEVRARVLSKPEPQYTEEARKSAITGTVSLRVVFNWSGEVTNIRAISTLPMGLTERAIAAARQIKFVPAMLNGRPVSVHMQLEYNFNLY